MSAQTCSIKILKQEQKSRKHSSYYDYTSRLSILKPDIF